MTDWEVTKLVLEYSFWASIACFVFLAVIVRVIIDYITFFSSWFNSPSRNEKNQTMNWRKKDERTHF